MNVRSNFPFDRLRSDSTEVSRFPLRRGEYTLEKSKDLINDFRIEI